MRTVYCLTKRVPDENFDVYVGSTSMSLEERLRIHVMEVRRGCRKSKLYERMREVGFGKWKIVPLLTLGCTEEEIRTFERKWCEILEADLNMKSPITSKEEARGKSKAWYAANREKSLKKKKEYREKNRDKEKTYREANKEKILKKQREYYAANREKFLEQRRESRRRKSKG